MFTDIDRGVTVDAAEAVLGLHSEQGRADPYRYYAVLHEHGQAVRFATPVAGYDAVVHGYEAVDQVLRDGSFHLMDAGYEDSQSRHWRDHQALRTLKDSIFYLNGARPPAHPVDVQPGVHRPPGQPAPPGDHPADPAPHSTGSPRPAATARPVDFMARVRLPAAEQHHGRTDRGTGGGPQLVPAEGAGHRRDPRPGHDHLAHDAQRRPGRHRADRVLRPVWSTSGATSRPTT